VKKSTKKTNTGKKLREKNTPKKYEKKYGKTIREK
jgi:hypothetical protein